MWYRYELVPLHTVVLIIVVGCEHALALLDMTEDPVELVERRVGKNQSALAFQSNASGSGYDSQVSMTGQEGAKA